MSEFNWVCECVYLFIDEAFVAVNSESSTNSRLILDLQTPKHAIIHY